MKRIVVISVLLFPILLSCDMLGDGAAGDEGELKLSFDSLPPDETRSGAEIPDTNDFLLCVSDAEGDTLYEGAYGDAPESMMVRPGNYCVRALSGKFSKPAFSSPQYGDEQCIVVESGESAFVRLLCSQMNSGVRLKISSDFLTAYSGASLLLRSSEGSLMYSYSEKRIAYFNPGNVSLVLSKGGSDDVLMTRWLEPGEILSLGVGVSSDASSGSHKGKREISISVDTSRVWKEEFFVIGGGDSGGDESETAMGITQAMSSVGAEGVWVRGYIVGGDLTASSGSFEEPFTSRTNIILGPKSSTADRSACLSVQLTPGVVRDKLNLVDNPEIRGRRVNLKGDIVASYFGLVGIKNVADYEFD